jgi:acyl-CoA-binding protein
MTVDAKTAVESLQAAKDVASLKNAIQQALFLDAIPGDDRQKLRAARTRLRQMLKEESAAAAAAAAAGPAEKSPWAKDSYDKAEFSTLSEKYESLNWRIISKPGGATVKPPEYYVLYAHYQQATQGDNSGERPMWAEKGGIDFEGREKWDSWEALKGMSADVAKETFVKNYYEFPASALYKDTRG